MKVRTKILALSVSGAAITALLIIGLVVARKTFITDQILAIMNHQAESSATVAAIDAYLMLKNQHENVQKKMASDVQLAKALLAPRERLAGRRDHPLEGEEPIQPTNPGSHSAQNDGGETLAWPGLRRRRG